VDALGVGPPVVVALRSGASDPATPCQHSGLPCRVKDSVLAVKSQVRGPRPVIHWVPLTMS
jgi:hypothetical protein